MLLFGAVQLAYASSTLQNPPFYFDGLLLLLLEIRQPIYCDDSPPLAHAIDAPTRGVLFKYRCKFLVANVNIFIVKYGLFEHK